jgi:S-adenosylmethionine decarboxylase
VIIGHHSTWDIYHCDKDVLSFVPRIEEILHLVVDELKLSKVNAAFKQFHPVGVTGFILLEESHISIHTWPEHNFAAVDVFSCQPFDVDKVKTLLQDFLKADYVECHTIERGRMPGMRNIA